MRGLRVAYGVVFLSFSSLSFADLDWVIDHNYDTFGGVNYKQSVIRPKNGWDQLFVKTQPGFDVYLGWRFHPHFSGELGYEWTANKPLTTDIAPHQSLLGVTNNSGTAVGLTGKVRFKTGHFDLNYFIPFTLKEWKPEWILSFGVGGMKPKMKVEADPQTDATNAFSSQFTDIDGRSIAVFRGGFGIQTNLIEDVGMRALIRYEHTSVLRARGTQITQNKATEQIFGNGLSIALGLYLKF